MKAAKYTYRYRSLLDNHRTRRASYSKHRPFCISHTVPTILPFVSTPTHSFQAISLQLRNVLGTVKAKSPHHSTYMATEKALILFCLQDGEHNTFQVKAFITDPIKVLKSSIRARCGVPEDADVVLLKVSSFLSAGSS
jgi:hypothetical protein